MAQNFDMIVIGAGPGGYVAAIRGAQLGLKVCVVEREHLGGICLNWGCIPTKALLRSSEVFHLMERAKEFGLKADNIDYDLPAVVKRSRGVAGQLSGGIGHLLKKNKCTVIMGEAKLAGKGKVSVKTDKGTEDLTAKNIIIATGARARELPGLEADPLQLFAGLFIGGGVILVGLAFVEFRKAATSVIPHQMPSQLITSGIYRRSRNPIYLADLCFLAGFALFWSSWLGLALVPVLALILTKRLKKRLA